ncbi:DNA-binding transcriptional regulator, MarR family [Polaribacter sp. KT 15]|nr:DNA-binding transcriptional regulator, MarR family [Polaribacter sp. KT 15]
MHNFFEIYYARIINFIIFEPMNKNKSIDHQLRATWQAVAKLYNEQALTHNSTMATAFVLLNIDKQNGTPSTALGPLMGMEPTSLSRILKNMEDKGAICREKNPDDGRSVIIKLTEYGKEMRKISKGHVIQFNETVINNVTEKDLEGFFNVTSTINKLIADKEIYKEINNKAV